MAGYSTKITDYGYKEKTAVYQSPITYGNANPVPAHGRQKYEDMPEHKQRHSDEKRVSYYKKKTAELIEIALMNPDLDRFLTLTFRESVTSYDMALAEWQLFLKRLRHLYPGKNLKYICVWEYQKKRGEKEHIEKGGVFHFHALMNLGYIQQKTLEKIWNQGFIYIERLENDRNREKAIRYTMKYCVKELTGQIENGESTRGRRLFFTSNNLSKPVVNVSEKKPDIEEIIFKHLENMLSDGSYDITNELDEVINHAQYAIYRK